MSVPHAKGIPSYRLHKATGQARVIIDGRHHYLGPHGSAESKARYEDLVRKLITDRAAAEMQARVQLSACRAAADRHGLAAEHLVGGGRQPARGTAPRDQAADRGGDGRQVAGEVINASFRPSGQNEFDRA